MADKPAFGVFPQMKPRRSQQDREAAKNVPVDLARGFVAGTLGMPADILNIPGDIYSAVTDKELYRIPFGSEDIERRLPFKSDTPVSRAATGAGQLGGGFYTGPLSGARAVTAIPKAVVQAGKDFVMAAPQGAPRMFIGPKAKTWDQAKADAAARMEKAGVDPVEIWRETGTFRGADGIQRQEVSDQSARFLSDVERKDRAELIESQIMRLKEQIKPTKQKDLFPKALTEAKKGARERIDRAKDAAWEYKKPPIAGVEAHSIFEHPELYRAYPELADVKIAAGGYGGDSKGALTAFPGVPGHGQPGIMEIDIFDRALKSDPRSTALHEMQHAVQTLEGMSPGGNITMAFNDPKAFEVLEEVRKRALTPLTFEEYAAKLSHIDPSELVKSYDKYVASIPEMVKKMDRELQSQAALEYYKRLAGEAEARATQFRREMTPQQRAEEYPYSSYDVPEESLITKPPKEFAEGGEVGGGAAFGVFPQMKGKRSKQDPEAAKTFPIDVVRGFVSGALGMPGDIESLVRMLPGLDEKTILPTSEDIEKRLPLRSESPLSKAATSLGQIGGGFYTGPLSGARAVTAIPKAIGKAGKDFVMAAGQPAVNVVKPKGGNWLTDRLKNELSYQKGNPRAAKDLEAYKQGYSPDVLATMAPEIRALENEVSINNWIDRNLNNYIKNQMATPEDPVRLMLDKRTAEVEAKFAKDMERANRLAERAAAELDPRMKANLTRNAEQAKMEAQADRDLSMSHILPTQELTIHAARPAAGEARVNRAVEGFPEEGMAKSPAGKAWEDITDSDIGVTANRAGDAQSAVEKKRKTDEALAAFYAKEAEIDDAFIKFMADRGVNAAELEAIHKALPSEQKLKYLKNPELKEEYERLEKAAGTARQSYKEKDLKIAEQYPWVEKLDPETRLYEFYGSHDLGFSHIIDVLKQDLAAGRITPEQLNRMSMDQAVRRAADYDKELAIKMNSARAAAREGLPVHKEYPEGFRWIELNKPGAFAAESEAMGHSVRGYEPPKGHPDWMEGSGNEGALYYGHGGWEAIKSGKAKVYSLVDPKGEPHVTVEVASGRHPIGYSFKGKSTDLPETFEYNRDFSSEYKRLTEDEKNAVLNRAKEIYTANPKMERMDAFQQASDEIIGRLPSEITQIKGKQNRAPKEEYLPYVQDFVRSGQWSDVRDLGNTGLIPIDPKSDLAVTMSKKGLTVPKYVAPDELTNLLKQAEVGSYTNPTKGETFINPQHPDWMDAPPAEGMKRGGSVSISDNADAQMMDVLDKKMAGGGLLGKVAKAAKQAKEPSLPLQLPRAPAKTKEEIRPIAQRIAQQMTGEFVRPDPAKSINPAGKSAKQFQMEKELTHDIRPVEGKTLLPQEVADIEKQLGMLKIGVSGDTTIADKVLHRAGPYELDLPSPQHGGPLFALGGEGAWASNNPTAATFQKRVQELSQAHGDAPTLGQFVAMGPEGSFFALHLADANLRAINLSKMTEKQIETVNDIIRQGTPKSGPRPGFPGIQDKDSAYLHFAFDPELRKAFNIMMSKPDYTSKLGLPDGRVIQHAITEPELRNSEILTSGLSQMRLDPSVNPADLALSAHPTYSHVIPKVPESAVTRTKYPTPAELEFPDVAEFIKQNYRPRDATRVYQTATPRQMVDPQHIDEIKMYEELMKEYTGKKEGGEVEMAGGGALVKAIKAAKSTAKEAPAVVIPSAVSRVQEAVRQSKGDYGAKRVQRAADEIKNLEKLYQEEGLRFAFTGDNAQALMTMNPADFEKFALELVARKGPVGHPSGEIDKYSLPTDEYIQYLQRLRGGFEEPAFLSINKEEAGLPLVPFISGHEGRHRSRALAASGQPTSLVRLIPRAELREPFPRRTQEEYIEALRKELEMTDKMVIPEGDLGAYRSGEGPPPRPAILLPTIYKNGGEVNVAGDGLIKVQKKRKAKA